MIKSDFTTGEEFWCGGHKWLCTDIGSRIIAAIRISGDHDIIEILPSGAEFIKTLDEAGLTARPTR
jgi:hypothetical protein